MVESWYCFKIVEGDFEVGAGGRFVAMGDFEKFM